MSSADPLEGADLVSYAMVCAGTDVLRGLWGKESPELIVDLVYRAMIDVARDPSRADVYAEIYRRGGQGT